MCTSQDDGVKAAKIIRKHLFLQEEVFDGNLSKEPQKTSVPAHLIHLVGLILEGATHYDNISKGTEIVALNLAHLLRFNAIKHKRRDEAINRRHSKMNEPPLPVLLGLMIHAKTRKKSIVETFATLGLSISYRRVQEIQDIITGTLCQKYEQDGLVCLPTLKEGLFTTAAIDNIDHNPSSSTAKSSFHGISISIFQYTDESDPPMQFSYDPTGVMKATTNKLPDFYTNIAPTKGGKTEPPALHPNEDLFPANFSTSAVASVWLHKLEKSITVDELSDRTSFSAFYSQEDHQSQFQTMSTMLPLLEESINSPAMIRHCMNIIKGLTDYLKVTFAPNLAKKLSPLFYYLILLFQLSVANPENFEEFKAQEVLKIRKGKTGVSTTSFAPKA